MKPTQQPVRLVGTGSLHDAVGKELNLDGTPKLPYRHPHFGQVTTVIPQLPVGVEFPARHTQQLQQEEQAELEAEGEQLYNP